MATLSRDLRRELERVSIQARRVGEEGAVKALEQLAVGNDKPWPSMTEEQRRLRVRLRTHGRQLGDKIDGRGAQSIRHLAQECAYEHWHRMLFARFLAESNLLIEPESGVAISLDECRELARQQGKDWLVLASEFAIRMLPQIFRSGDPVLEISLPPETRNQLEALLKSLQAEVFAADDSLGWVYQFWQTEQKQQINDAGMKIGPDELPAVTQLFTEDYMVLFLLHNTLGAWWAAKRKTEGKDLNLRGYEWTYLRLKEDGAPAAGNFDGWPRAAKEIKLLDPSMGSGHFLVFALPILAGFRMEDEGLSREEAVAAVLRDNLFGLELDNRCTQIAAFNLAFTAWRMIGHARELPSLNLACSGLGINAKREDWLKLAARDDRQRETMDQLYSLFSQAPILGSLIDPSRAGGTLFTGRFEEARPALERALEAERGDETEELAVAAKGIVKAAHVLADKFTLVVTNVPYLVRAKQNDALRDYCERYSSDGAADLATVFVDRCMAFLEKGGTSATVTPQNWCFLRSYSNLRRRLLTSHTLDHATKIGSGATATASWDVLRALTIITKQRSLPDYVITGVEADSPSDQERADEIRVGPLLSNTASILLGTRDARIALAATYAGTLLSIYADSLQGISTGDNPRFQRLFWEVTDSQNWAFEQGPVSQTTNFGGREKVIHWESGHGALARHEGSAVRGLQALERRGVAVTQMRELPATLFSGTFFDTNVAVILPKDDRNLPAIWAYCSSPQFASEVRKIDKKLNVTNATLTQVPFDLVHWGSVARAHFPTGLPTPGVAEATNWLFDGRPAVAMDPLQIAVLRLCGYRWPRQMGSSFMDCPALGPDGLEKHADADGIVCLTSLQGERPAADRLRALLADALRSDWSAAKQNELLAQVGFESLEAWLRDGFFEQHCEPFQQRPFIWHIWDGLRDGFHALVNYHKLAARNGEGRRTLEKLIYSYVGDWIERQRVDQRNGVDGADGRLAAALHLKKELEAILQGKPPYDIFVRWKPLHEQPLGWEPDINNGVRINIRPFMTARTIKGSKNGCILRVTPSGIRWDKADRGNEPHCAKQDFPWFWKWDGKTEDFAGGHEFDGKRWNDLHYSLETKQQARERHAEQKAGNKAQEVSR